MGIFSPLQANSWMVVPSTTMTKEREAGRRRAHDPRARPLCPRARTGDGTRPGEPADGGRGPGHPAVDAAGEAGGAGAVRVRGLRVRGADAGVRELRLLG